MLPPDDLRFLERQIRRSAWENLITGTVLALVGAGFVGSAIWYLARHPEISAKDLALPIFGLIVLALSAGMVRTGIITRDPTRHRLYTVLTERPHEVAWAHGIEGAIHECRVYYLDGTYDDVAAFRRNASALLAIIERNCPSVLIGYGKEQERAFHERVKRRLA